MVWLYIIGGFLILLLLFLFMKVTIRVSYIGDLQVWIRFLFIKLKIYPLKEKAEEKAPPIAKKQKKPKEPKPEKPKPPLAETINLIKELFIEIITKFGRYIKLEEYRIKVLVATDDPAKTGVLYGIVCGTLGSVSVFIDRLKKRTRKKGRIYTEVTPDFIAGQSELYVSAAMSMRIWQFFSMGITATRGFLRYNSLRKETDAKNKITEVEL
ncbi:MAG: DUF2953 domain-containing protein [Eubacteriales bacterium]|nr:DUF2953 domain-containing protein [Eubacteriales bacterium]MDD4421543.1 DUF2953 domain-containing protein [Eubacteriales bacterium]HBR32818.1 hypothetical protein [Clostridiales bacterium]